MLLIRSLLFNLFFYAGIVTVFLIALPTLFLPSKFTLYFGKFLGHYVVFIIKIFLDTKVEFKGVENIPKNNLIHKSRGASILFETEFVIKWNSFPK